MSLQVYCAVCERELVVPGALLFGPPDDDDVCHKKHLCDACYFVVLRVFDGIREAGQPLAAVEAARTKGRESAQDKDR